MIVLIGVNCDNGKVVEVGLYDDVEAARPYVAKNGGRRILYSVWTPEQNETMSTPAITGLSLPPVA